MLKSTIFQLQRWANMILEMWPTEFNKSPCDLVVIQTGTMAISAGRIFFWWTESFFADICWNMNTKSSNAGLTMQKNVSDIWTGKVQISVDPCKILTGWTGTFVKLWTYFLASMPWADRDNLNVMFFLTLDSPSSESVWDTWCLDWAIDSNILQ